MFGFFLRLFENILIVVFCFFVVSPRLCFVLKLGFNWGQVFVIAVALPVICIIFTYWYIFGFV